MNINHPAVYLIAGPALGILAYWLRARTDVWRLTKTADVSAINTPFNVLREILQNRDKENVEMRAQMHTIITNHLEHDAVDRQGAAKAMQDLANTQRELIEMIRDDRLKGAAAADKLNETLTEIRVELGRGHA